MAALPVQRDHVSTHASGGTAPPQNTPARMLAMLSKPRHWTKLSSNSHLQGFNCSMGQYIAWCRFLSRRSLTHSCLLGLLRNLPYITLLRLAILARPHQAGAAKHCMHGSAVAKYCAHQ